MKDRYWNKDGKGIPFTKLLVTGVLRTGKRFKTKIYEANTAGIMHVNSINLWNGSIWGATEDGKRTLIKRVCG